MEKLDIIETLKRTPDRLAEAIEGVPEATLRFRPSDGEWSAKEVVGHVRDMAEVWHKRLYMVWSLTDPLFTSFDGEQAVKDRGYQERDPRAVIEEMRAIRRQTIDLLAHAVDWTRLGMQPGMGRRTLKQFAEYVVSHEENHLAQIESLKQAAKSGAVA